MRGILRPRSGNLPPRMGRAYTSGELVGAEGNSLRKVSSQQRDFLWLMLDCNFDGKHGCKPGDVVVPENSFDLRQVRFAEKGAVSRRFQVDSANFQVERIFLRGDDQVGADGAQLAVT